MIAIFDEDGGGDVDFQEFISGLSAFSSKGNKEEKLRFAFKVYDIDRDGYISNGELFIVLKMMVGSNLKDQQLQQIVDKTIMEADLDHDGKISFEEFTKMVENTDVSMSMTLGMYCELLVVRMDVWVLTCEQTSSSGDTNAADTDVRRWAQNRGRACISSSSSIYESYLYMYSEQETGPQSALLLCFSWIPAFFSQPWITCVWQAPGPATRSASANCSTIKSESAECGPVSSMSVRAIFMSFNSSESWYPDAKFLVSPYTFTSTHRHNTFEARITYISPKTLLRTKIHPRAHIHHIHHRLRIQPKFLACNQRIAQPHNTRRTGVVIERLHRVAGSQLSHHEDVLGHGLEDRHGSVQGSGVGAADHERGVAFAERVRVFLRYW